MPTHSSTVFPAHARNDDNVPFAESEAFFRKAEAAGRDVTSSISRGGPDALEWLEE